MTTVADIQEWLERGKSQEATHMIVVCDTWDHEDYPVYVKPGEDVRKKVDEYLKQSHSRVMEVYSYKIDLEEQLIAHRAFNYD